MRTGNAIKIAKSLDEMSFQSQLLSANALYESHCCNASGAHASLPSDDRRTANSGRPRCGWIQRVVRELHRCLQSLRSLGRLLQPTSAQTETRAVFLMDSLWELSAAGYGKSTPAMANARCRSPFVPLGDMETDTL
jgi:hypothetical protein